MKKMTVGLLMGAVIWVGCAMTRFNNIQSDIALGTYYKKIIVHSDLADPATRKIIEDTVVQQLQTAGVEAIASDTIFPPGDQTSWDAKKQTISADGFDACLLVKVVSSYSKIKPALFVNRTMVNIYTAHFKIQTLILEAHNFTVVWQARSGSREGMADNGDFSVEGMIDSYASALVGELQGEGIVIPTLSPKK